MVTTDAIVFIFVQKVHNDPWTHSHQCCQIDVNPQIKIVNVIVNIAESIQEPGLGSKDAI